jgi:hypothetical protein
MPLYLIRLQHAQTCHLSAPPAPPATSKLFRIYCGS